MEGAPATGPGVRAKAGYPVRFEVDYPDRKLSRLRTALRLFWVIPIGVVLATVSGVTFSFVVDRYEVFVASSGGLLFAGPLLMILFRKKYPRWWFDFNRELLRFTNRVCVYLALMDDRYPSTDEPQSVRLEIDYPDVDRELMRGMPLIKWLLAIPHYVVLFALTIAALVALVIAWFAIVIGGRYPRALFDFVAGVIRWSNRVLGYAIVLVTDRYPPFRLSA